MLPDDVKEQATKILQPMDSEVVMEFHEEPSAQLNTQIKELLQDITAMNAHITLKVDSEGDNRPFFDLKGKNKGIVRFMGLPSGHEFSTLLSALVMTSTGNHQLAPETVEFLNGLDKPLDLKVFITPTCPYCPSAALLAQKMAMVNEKITGVMVEAMEFPELSRKFNVTGVPRTIVNDSEGGFVGAHPEQSAIEEIKKAL